MNKSFRAISPEETLKKISPHLKKMGITRLANITGLDEIGIPVYIAFRPNSRSLSLSQGKGLDHASARVSALMETIESFHAENYSKEIIEFSINDAEKKQIDICDYQNLPVYREAQLSNSETISWVRGKEIFSGKDTFVPYDSVNTDFRVSVNQRPLYFSKGSNGLASGNTAEEAIVHALCELIERDAYSCWTLKPSHERKITKVIKSSISCSTSNALIERFEKANTHIGIWDVTSDIGIPTFLVRVMAAEKPPYTQIRPASGYGCHPDRSLALIRALTEAAQSRLTFISGARDDVRLSHYRTFISQEQYEIWRKSVFEDREMQTFEKIKNYNVTNTREIFINLKDALSKIGVKQIIAVDLSIDEFSIPVYKVIVPGLEGGEGYKNICFGKRALKILESVETKEKIYA